MSFSWAKPYEPKSPFMRWLDERLPEIGTDDLGMPEVSLMLVTDLAVLDHTDGTVLLIANALGKHPRDVGYAGMKDAHGVTRQWISIEHVDDARLRVGDAYLAAEALGQPGHEQVFAGQVADFPQGSLSADGQRVARQASTARRPATDAAPVRRRRSP